MTPQSASSDDTTVPSKPGDLAFVLKRNVAAMRERREEALRSASLSDRLADTITGFTGSMKFVVLHLLIFGVWIGVNLAGPEAWRFDPTFVALAMAASVEAIFLSTFVLISQNRNSEIQEERAQLDLQINLLAEHEITRLVDLTTQIAEHLGIQTQDAELDELRRDVAPDAVLDHIETEEEAAAAASKRDKDKT